MFVVYESNIKAQFPDYKVDPSWNTALYPTFDEALTYTKLWLGSWSGCIVPGWDGSPINFTGYGDQIEIRKEETFFGWL